MPITVLRLSDNSRFVIDEASPGTFVNSIKSNVRKNFYPKFPNGNLAYLFLYKSNYRVSILHSNFNLSF